MFDTTGTELKPGRYASRHLTDSQAYVYAYGSGNILKLNDAAQAILGYPDFVRVFILDDDIVRLEGGAPGTRLRNEVYTEGVRWRTFQFRKLIQFLGLGLGEKRKYPLYSDGRFYLSEAEPMSEDRKVEKLDD